MRSARYYAKAGDPDPWFKDPFERCDAVSQIVTPGADDDVPDNVHMAAWTHVRDCLPCLRNVSRALYMAGNTEIPLPVFTEPRPGEPDCTIPDCPCGAQRKKEAN